jgi:peroxiredoxin
VNPLPRWLKILLELAAIVVLIVAVRVWTQQGLAGGKAPPLTGTDLAGSELSLAGQRGRPVLVHFWATWCPVCRLEEDSIESIARDHAVIAVAMQSGGADELAAYMAGKGLSFPVLNDPDGSLAARYGVRGVPSSFVVDASGDIRFVEVGYTTSLGLRLRLWLAGLGSG